MKIGIRGAGFMTRRVAETINMMGDEYELYALHSSSLEKAQEFQREYGFQKIYTDYDEFLDDPELDLVYIALTNQFHKDATIACIEHGKASITEKPFCMNVKEAEEVFKLADEKKVFTTEATWPNYAPARWLVDDLLKSGIVGDIERAEITMANAVYRDHFNRMDPLDHGGGALMDFAAYTIGSMTMAHFGHDLNIVEAKFEFMPSGVDIRDWITLEYDGGPRIEIYHNADQPKPFVKFGKFYGTNGMIEVDGTSNITGLRAYDAEGNVIKEVEIPKMLTGYEYEFEACKRALEAGDLECPEQSHEQTLAELRMTDKLRAIAPVPFPCD